MTAETLSSIGRLSSCRRTSSFESPLVVVSLCSMFRTTSEPVSPPGRAVFERTSHVLLLRGYSACGGRDSGATKASWS